MKFYLPIFLTIIAANPCMLPGSNGQLIFGFFRRISLHLYFRRNGGAPANPSVTAGC